MPTSRLSLVAALACLTACPTPEADKKPNSQTASKDAGRDSAQKPGENAADKTDKGSPKKAPTTKPEDAGKDAGKDVPLGAVKAPPAPPGNAATSTKLAALPKETHLSNLRRLTNGGENAEAYFSFDESQLIFQTTRNGTECDQIYTMKLDGSQQVRVSSGKGRTTCAYFLPGDKEILYASTHAADDGCLPPPDRSLGYVWKLYSEFDIYAAKADGSGVRPLITGPGYDAEATVSPTGGTFVFTSTRDGDPELYSANIDGSGVRRLTTAKGYDGGAFYSPDGSKIIYRANHPEGKDELAKYDEIIKQGLVRPTRLELFVMDKDGSNQTQVTHNGKANFGPYWHPDGKRVIFASNVNAPKGRNFDLYIIGVDGKGLEQLTFNESFDGFPMFSRDGKTLVFASNRENAKHGDTNIFLADWSD